MVSIKAYKIKVLSDAECLYKIVEVEVDKLQFPYLDSEGDMVYENTHFATKEEARNVAINRCNDMIRFLNDQIKHREKSIADIKKTISKYEKTRNLLMQEQADDKRRF